MVTKTVGLRPAVNPTPHISRVDGTGLLNAEKWSDVPAEQWLERELPALTGRPGLLIVSLGNGPADVAALAGPLGRAGADLLEVVSYDAGQVARMVEIAAGQTGVPVLAKVSANWPDLIAVVGDCIRAGAEGITAIDSLGPALGIDVETGRPVLGGAYGHGWLSGAAIKPMALHAVAEIRLHFDIPVVGVGGVGRGRDAVEMMMAGAVVVGAHTAPLLRGLAWFRRTVAELNAFLDSHRYASAEEIVGRTLPYLRAEERTAPLAFAFDRERCTACLRCVALCPYQARRLTVEEMSIAPERCRSCGLCASVCGPGALRLVSTA